jgi:hypothetical protein
VKKKPVVLQFLFDRHLARRFAQRVEAMAADRVPLLMQSLLSAALIDPAFLVKHLKKYDFLNRQISTQRGLIKPQVISIHCKDEAERRALCRTLLAVTVEATAALGGPVLPDPTTVLAALVECWVADAAALRPKGRAAHRKSKSAFVRPATRFRRDDLPPLAPPKKSKDKSSRPGSVLPHPEYPDVAKQPITWRPGSRGRPPKEAWCNGYGVWVPPAGWRVIRGAWHPPLQEANEDNPPAQPAAPNTDESNPPIDPAGGGEQQQSPSRPSEDSPQPPPAGGNPD